MAVELALTPDARWPGTVAELVSAAADAGFDAVGISGEQVDGATVEAYRAAGVRCREVLALSLDGADERATLAAAEHLAAAAAAIGAPWVLTVFLGSAPASDGQLLRRCASILAESGAGMAVEFTPLGPVATIADGLDVVRTVEAGGDRAGLLIDTWHFFRGASTWDDLERVPLEAIAFVQFDDALPPEPGRSMIAETLHRRALPGAGELDLHRFAATLLDRGWEGTVSAEVLNAELRTLPIGEIVRRVHDATAPYWRTV